MATGLENEKAQTYLINVVILEGRHYIWSNATTAVVVKIKNKKKSTAVRYGTDNPYYNEVHPKMFSIVVIIPSSISVFRL